MKSIKFVLPALAISLGWIEGAHAQITPGGVMVQDQGVSADVMATRGSIIDNGTTAHADSEAQMAMLTGAPATVQPTPVSTLQATLAEACDSIAAAGGAAAAMAPAIVGCVTGATTDELAAEAKNNATLSGEQEAAVAARDAAAARVGSATTEYEATAAASQATMSANDAQLVENNAQAETRRRQWVKYAVGAAATAAVLTMLLSMTVQ